MLVEQLSIAYRCHCAIGNSVNLKEMVQEVLKTFVSETYAVYGHFSLINEENILQKFHSFGKINNFNCKYYREPLIINYQEHFSNLSRNFS